MQHLDEGTIHTWLDGELSAADATEAERHIAECAECAAAVAEARGMIAGATRIVSALDVGLGAVAAAPRQPAKPVVARSAWRMLRLTPTRAALAASLLVAAGALLTVRHDVPERKLDAPMAMSASPAVAPVPASGAPADVHASPPPSMRTADSTAPAPLATRPPARDQAARKVAEAARPDSAGQITQPTANSVAGTSASAPKVVAAAPAAPPLQPTPIVAPPAAAGAVAARAETQRAVLDSLATKVKVTEGAAADSRRQLQSIAAPSRQFAAAASGLDIAGCYRIKSDSAALTRLLPERFALERTPGTGAAASNVVRAVTADGRMDTVVTGSNWIQLSNDKAQIHSIVGTKQQVVSLQLTSLGGVSGQAMTNRGAHAIAVSRAVCHP